MIITSTPDTKQTQLSLPSLGIQIMRTNCNHKVEISKLFIVNSLAIVIVRALNKRTVKFWNEIK